MLSETEAATLWSQALDGLFFEELPPDVESAFRHLAERESRSELYALLARVRDLQANGVLVRMENAPELRLLAEYALERYDRLKRRRGALEQTVELGFSGEWSCDQDAAIDWRNCRDGRHRRELTARRVRSQLRFTRGASGQR